MAGQCAGVGVLVAVVESTVEGDYINRLAASGLVPILIALLAINSATMGLVLRDVRELARASENRGVFDNTRAEMLHSVREQIALVVFALLILVFRTSRYLSANEKVLVFIDGLSVGVLIYALSILYDNAKSIIVLTGE